MKVELTDDVVFTGSVNDLKTYNIGSNGETVIVELDDDDAKDQLVRKLSSVGIDKVPVYPDYIRVSKENPSEAFQVSKWVLPLQMIRGYIKGADVGVLETTVAGTYIVLSNDLPDEQMDVVKKWATSLSVDDDDDDDIAPADMRVTEEPVARKFRVMSIMHEDEVSLTYGDITYVLALAATEDLSDFDVVLATKGSDEPLLHMSDTPVTIADGNNVTLATRALSSIFEIYKEENPFVKYAMYEGELTELVGYIDTKEIRAALDGTGLLIKVVINLTGDVSYIVHNPDERVNYIVPHGDVVDAPVATRLTIVDGLRTLIDDLLQ